MAKQPARSTQLLDDFSRCVVFLLMSAERGSRVPTRAFSSIFTDSDNRLAQARHQRKTN